MSRVAAVTGGSAGIGKAICERLLTEGHEVVSLARRRRNVPEGAMPLPLDHSGADAAESEAVAETEAVVEAPLPVPEPPLPVMPVRAPAPVAKRVLEHQRHIAEHTYILGE